MGSTRPLRIIATALAALLFFAATGQAQDFVVFRDVTLIPSASNDGDSFHVTAGGRHLLVRLYFVDCPETTALAKTDARRLSEQMAYFGLPNVVETVHFGKQAAAFTAKSLSAPFTIYTTFASAPGRSSLPRIYAFVETADGTDLGTLLVAEGLARPHGVARKTPDGIDRDEMAARLKDMEGAAMLKRKGIWARSDPERMAELRARQREEDRRLADIQRQAKEMKGAIGLIDVNTADRSQLEAVDGIGPALARRIIDGRPYATIEDLLRVQGIGHATLKRLKTVLTVVPDTGAAMEKQ